MGQLKIVPGGIQLTGQALIMDMLRASSIRSRHGQPLSIGKIKQQQHNKLYKYLHKQAIKQQKNKLKHIVINYKIIVHHLLANHDVLCLPN